MAFSTIHTDAGLSAMYGASTGSPINLTHMSVGDGNGNEVTPDASQTALVREVYRAAINRVYKPDAVNYPSLFAAELVIPATEGGFTMREVGVFDSDGTLFAVGNLPATYKPEASEGAFSDTVVRLEFMATNSDVVSIMFDPAVAVVTQNWIANNVTAATLIPGGTTEQVLAKQSNADGDYIWKDPTDANVVVNTIEETQTLADAQTVVTFATVTNVGVAIYIEGVRLPNDATVDGWQADGLDVTKITLGKSYPAGVQMIAVQNEPASSFPDALRKELNLADVESVAATRANLDVFSKSETRQMAPAGAVMDFAMPTAPTGWIKANGAAVSRTVYADLFSAIGTTFGAGNGSTTFNVPDCRGQWRRGWDDGRGVDIGRVFGSEQADEIKAHSHRILGGEGGEGTDPPSNTNNIAGMDRQRGYVAGNPALIEQTGGIENRVRNTAFLTCIKY